MNKPHHSHAAPLLVVGCVVFGLGSLIVKFVDVGSYAIAFWRLAIAAVIFWLLSRLFGQKLPKSRKAIYTAMLSGVFLAFDLSLWHESIQRRRPRYFHLAQQFADIFPLRHRFLLFWRTFEQIANVQPHSRHQRRRLYRQP